MAITCLIPARGRSKRFPSKNIALFKNKPLIAHTIETATASGLFEDIWVSTDDDAIGEISKNAGALIHERPLELAADSVTLVQVSLDFVGWLRRCNKEIDSLCVIFPTAALLRPDDLRGGHEIFENGACDFVMAVTKYFYSPFWASVEENGFLKPAFGSEYFRQKQLLPEVFVNSGSFYIARIDALERERTFYGERLSPYKIPEAHAFDIDEPIHLHIAESLYDYRENT